MMMSPTLRPALLAGAFCLLSAAATAAPYTTTIVEYPGAKETYPLAENNAGTVVGYWDDSNYVQHGFIYQAGKLSNFNPPNALSAVAQGINEKGDIAGYYTDANSVTHGFLYTAKTGKFKTADLPGSGATTLDQINRSSLALGAGTDSGGNGEIFTYKHGIFTTVIDDQESPVGNGINNSGTIIGSITPPGSRQQAYIYSGGVLTTIPFTDNFYSIAFAVSEQNEAAGQYVNSEGRQFGFLYTPGGKITEVQPKGASFAFFLAINNHGDAAGATFDANYNSLAWVYHEKTGRSVTFGVTGYSGVAAVGINDSGQVIGECVDANNIGCTVIALPKE